ncbi:MAG: hypothetical protein RLZZ360_785 [Candidatus Parcubacteria bacterium]|jgi:predicted N-acetyltransferase YhbS
MKIRDYNPETDFDAVKSLLCDSSTYGGDFDEARDSKDRIDTLGQQKPGSVLVAELDNEIVGTVTLFEDGRSAWLYRFAVAKTHEDIVTDALWQAAKEIMRSWGHTQILVYAPAHDAAFSSRYSKLGFTAGNDFTAYWQNI